MGMDPGENEKFNRLRFLPRSNKKKKEIASLEKCILFTYFFRKKAIRIYFPKLVIYFYF